MPDDRAVLRENRENHESRGEFVWTPGRQGQTASAGPPPRGRHQTWPPRLPTLPCPRNDLSGLRPTWIGVGTLDLFHPEDRTYAQRLNEAGVTCEFLEVAGGDHASELFMPGASVSGAFLHRSLDALRRGLHLDRAAPEVPSVIQPATTPTCGA